MLRWLQMRWWTRFLVFVVGYLQLAPQALAEDRRLLSLLPGNAFSTPKDFPSPLKRPEHYREDDFFYREFFASADKAIKQEYMDRWTYHEQRIPYSLTSWRHEHLSIGTLDYYDRAPYEGTVRNDFAGRVLRLRFHTALTQYLSKPEHAVLKRAESALREMQSVPIRQKARGDSEPPPEFRYGYDLWEDCYRLEIITKATSFGIYHPQLLSMLTEGSLGRNIQAWIRTETGLGVSTALVYHFSREVIEAGFSRAFATGVVGDVSTTQSLRGDQAPSIRMQLSFQF